MELDEIWQTVQEIMTPLKHFQDALGLSGQEQVPKADGLCFAKAVYDFLIDSGAKERLEQTVSNIAKSAEEERTLRLNAGAWDILMELLDVFAHVLQEIPLSLEQHRELFLMAALSSDIGSIPNTLDQVSIGSADRMRPNSPKATIVIGVNQGEFPPQLSENGLFSEVERDRLLKAEFS